MKKVLTTVAFLALMMSSMQAQKYDEVKHTDPNGFSYVTVSNDEKWCKNIHSKKWTKSVFSKKYRRSENPNLYLVRAGSNDDPADNTGLAHYLEHMMFKGT